MASNSISNSNSSNLNSNPINSSSSSSSNKPIIATYTWNIKNFATTNAFTCSSLFRPSGDRNYKFDLSLYPNCRLAYLGPDIGESRQTIIWLTGGVSSVGKSNISDSTFTVLYRLSIQNVSGEKCFTREGFKRFSVTHHQQQSSQMFQQQQQQQQQSLSLNLQQNLTKKDYVRSNDYCIDRNALLNPENGLLINGKLVINCEVQVLQCDPFLLSSTGLGGAAFGSRLDRGIYRSSEDYLNLLKTGQMSDCTLIVNGGGGNSFPAHRLILSCRSPVFAAMFEHQDTREAREGQVHITDVQPDVFEHFLRYLYTGKLDNPESTLDIYAVELLMVADKYVLDCLKSICSGHLASTKLSIESAAKLLLLADMYSAQDLKLRTIDFITQNASKVIKTEGWKELTDSRLELVVELFKKLAIKTNH